MGLFLKWVLNITTLTALAAAQTVRAATDSAGVVSVAGTTPNAVQSKWWDATTYPTRWWDWGLELRLRNEYQANAVALDSEQAGHESNYQRYRARLWSHIRPLEGLHVTARLVTEPRSYQLPGNLEGWRWDEGTMDELSVTLTNLFKRPVSLVLGRQSLQFGNRWLVWDGTGWDGSRTEFFDAARLTQDWEEAQTRTDVVYVDLHREASAWLPPIQPSGQPLGEQDERGAILYVSNRSVPMTTLEGFFLYRHEYHPLPVVGDAGDLYVVGGRAEGSIREHWKYRAELAEELGRKNGRGLTAFGVNTRVSYFLRDRWNHNFRLGWEYLSGDDPATASDEGWDAMWGRRAQWSELLVFTFTTEGHGRKADWTNLQRLDVGWSFNPHRRVEVLLDYLPLFANTHPGESAALAGGGGRFRGHLTAAVLNFRLSDQVNGHLWGEWFFPGDYYSPGHRDTATFLRVEFSVAL